MGFSLTLVSLCVLSALGHGIHVIDETADAGAYDYSADTGGPGAYEYEYYDYEVVPEEETTYDDSSDWLYDLIDSFSTNECDPNPCQNGGSCDNQSNTTADGGFVCMCPERFTGNKCQTVRDGCKNVKCGHGHCVATSVPPYHECKCKVPYKLPDCKKVAPCNPSPCENGGTCIKGRSRPFYSCGCPNGFSGKFCQLGPNDCSEGDGESYRGKVSVTDGGEECLDWNSHAITKTGSDPLTEYQGDTGIGPHNYCRNPDGESSPWCFLEKNGTLKWDFCTVRKCSAAPATQPPPTPVKPDVIAGQFSQCGRPQTVRTGRIYGGRKPLAGAHPWQVSLQFRPAPGAGDFHHLCGGILIESCWVLTAAHCIKPGVDMQVVMGGVDLERREENEQVVPVQRVIVHEDYTATPSALHNDIALLQLKVTDSPYCAKESRFVKTACLPNQLFSDGKECVISGWGATETQEYGSSQLLSARVLLISQNRCTAPHVYGNTLDDSMFCAGYMGGKVDSCQGDSGGPLVCERDGAHYVSGVVSWGKGCGEKNKPGVYANVHKYVDWIAAKIIS